MALTLVCCTTAIVSLRVFAGGWLAGCFEQISLTALPAAERRLIEFLLLLPVAALVICAFRNLIGLTSFGTFAPALIGLVFRDWQSLPGLSVFVGLLVIGWMMRRLLDRFHLLQVPRASVMLSLVIAMLVVFVAVASRCDLAVTKYVSLFPVIILTGMVERFWLLEADDGTGASFRTLANTVLIAIVVALVTGIPAISSTMLRFPEMLGVVVALQMLIGRYTGYRLTELWRFREFSAPLSAPPQEEVLVFSQSIPGRRF
jgi:hypothetical protein